MWLVHRTDRSSHSFPISTRAAAASKIATQAAQAGHAGSSEPHGGWPLVRSKNAGGQAAMWLVARAMCQCGAEAFDVKH